MGRYITPDFQWARESVDKFPQSWAGRLLSKWGQRHGVDRYAANIELLRQCKSINRAQLVGVAADANDAEICQVAKDTARDMARRLDQRQAITNKDQPAAVSPWSLQWVERAGQLSQLAEALFWLDMRGVSISLKRRSIESVLRRVVCEKFWRRMIRRIHTMAVETVARRMGLVHKRAGCYVSDDTLKRRTGQLARNAAALESVDATNERGQAFTLAELAAKGSANKEIRRHELMTRIAGFELIAKDCAHEAFFVTVTCPSRMHAFRKLGEWKTGPNPRHDGTTIDVAHQYLTKQWSLCRSAADRAGLGWYGFRIAEPNHDGTPHWHMLLFVQPVRPFFERRRIRHWDAGCMVAEKLRRYFLANDSRDEKGAREKRIDFERIDWTKGSAAAYVAKYVSKNIDGYKVDKDLHGNDCMTASRRVDAWASTWRVRQFQQVGGPPVTTWRELRRLHPKQEGAATAVAEGLNAVNQATQQKRAATEAVELYTAANGWADYVRLQGGPRVPRRLHNIKILREQTGEIGRYGDLMAPKPVGVATDEHHAARYVPAFGIVRGFWVEQRTVRVEVESERSTWTIGHAVRGVAKAASLRPSPARAAGLRPWSPVNNCTASRPDVHPVALFGASVQRVAKRGRAFNWAKQASGTGGGEPESKHEQIDRRIEHHRGTGYAG